VEDLRFRGLFQRAVRAPNLFELTFPITSGTDNLSVDPCAGTNPIGKPTVIAKCVAQGAPSALIGIIIQPIAGQVNNFTGGNPALNAEVSNTWTVGFVTEPKFFPGFSLSADYFSVNIKDAIVPFGGTASNVVDACFTLNDAFACSQIKRNTVTGSLSGGTTVGVTLTNQNAAQLATSGIDVASSYRFNAFGGKIGLNFFGTYLKSYKLETFDVSSCAGQFGFECGEPLPRWKHTLDVDYSLDNGVGVSTRWRMVGSVTEDSQTAIAKSSIPVYNYFDISASWELNKHFTLRGGISNLINTKPPVVGGDAGTTASNSGNTFPNTYDTLGRTFFIGLTGRI
ncbi:MAG: TonB-dependent receptor, partial [Parvularculaceae bacterium]|nr:TonB-dependent receptor [Parvularculaceae bacterium]